MATIRQKKALDKIVEKGRNNKRISVSGIMREVGYSAKTAVEPGKLTNSIGFKQLLEEYGLTEGLITKALVSDIKKKPKKRYAELNLGAEILGMKKREDSGGNTFNTIIFADDRAKRIARRILAGNTESETESN